MQTASFQSAETRELPEQKRVLISVGWSHIDVLIAHELRPGSGGHMLNAAADARLGADGTLVWQKCGAVRAVLPRMLEGLTFWIDGQPQTTALRELDVKPGAVGSCGAGMVALGRFRLDFPCSPLHLREVAIEADELEHSIQVEFQTVDNVQALEASTDHDGQLANESVVSLESNQTHWIRVHGCCQDSNGMDEELS
jgi:hypothetical protein